MSEAAKQHEEFLSAYLDNELSNEDRARAETMIRDNPKDAQLVQSWRENAAAIRDMPRYKLGANFSNRVLQAIESQATSTPPTNVVNVNRTNENWSGGMLALVGLAAMLLLSVFVFPMFSGSNAGIPVASNLPASTGVETPGEPVTPVKKRQPVTVGLNQRLAGSGNNNNQPVAPIALAEPVSQPAGVEHILWINDASLEVVKEVLDGHEIEVMSRESEDSQFEVVDVVATADQMKEAIAELSTKSSTVANLYRLSEIGSAGTARLVDPIDLTKDLDDEIASLDEWFGLAAADDGTRQVRFLLFIRTNDTK